VGKSSKNQFEKKFNQKSCKFKNKKLHGDFYPVLTGDAVVKNIKKIRFLKLN
jgi:hypothetical protein